MSERVFNFCAGPAIMPEPVLREAQKDLVSLPGVGMSILEIGHRSHWFDEILEEAESNLRRILGLEDHFRVLFLQQLCRPCGGLPVVRLFVRLFDRCPVVEAGDNRVVELVF